MVKKIKVRLPEGKEKVCVAGTTILEILVTGKGPGEPLLALVKGEEVELTERLHDDVILVPITLKDPQGAAAYLRGLSFLLIKAVKDIFPEAGVTIEHSLGKGIYGEIHYTRKINERDIAVIKERMQQIVTADEKIERIEVKKEEAVRIFTLQGMTDKLRLLKYINLPRINLYRCGDLYDYFYGPMVPSMGYLKVFDLLYYDPGFILMYPQAGDPFHIPPFHDLPKLARIFKEAEEWANILDVGDVGALNDKVVSGEINEIILVNEGLHEKKIANIADMIYAGKDKIKIVLIAGPSSSGKTTFARRLSIQLRVLGLKPYPLSLDDYFVDREHTPKDESGNYDFESIRALDLELFNQHLAALLNGEEVEIPRFNFRTGLREWIGRKYKMEKDSVLVIEGIHGLNEILTSSVPRENKYKIYISALTQLNIDNHNRIPTTDSRLMRRIVRDYLYRGRDAATTILTWPQVRAGEEKNIFPYQEEADIMFNSALVYEMCILKKYAAPLLREIPVSSPAYLEAKRLLTFLSYFLEAEENAIPNNSIIREFIGGSCFE
ncbi:nucleoside kinase [Neomoorella humiferrea]|uniref:Threonine--tRNA ligase 2 n=1 Tax=Neomoorella humiferrea TaxID=676965 RepID=A0A2T0AN63_9FIRM|nr:nucleoside kinase [Moorella humiferrea]PRR70308.1 Threonine--tRNA ligase 2 [Moorella humiferrea]